MMFIGIDPGLTGGIACVDRDGHAIVARRMPETERDVYDVLLSIVGRQTTPPARAMLERVSASPQMGVVSAFTFGKGYGGLKMALHIAAIPFDEVTPAKWQQVMQCRTGGDKTISKRRAQQLFPNVIITHHIADALLIAEFCRRVERGLVQPAAAKARTRGKATGENTPNLWTIGGRLDEADAPARATTAGDGGHPDRAARRRG